MNLKFLRVLSLSTLVAAAIATPNLEARAAFPVLAATPTVTICLFQGSGCIPVPMDSGNCTSFTGALAILNDAVGLVTVPSGFLCHFFPDSACTSFAATAVIGTDSAQFVSPGFPSFSSVLCSPVG